MTDRELRDLAHHGRTLSRAESRDGRIGRRLTREQQVALSTGRARISGASATFTEFFAGSNNSTSATYTPTLPNSAAIGDMLVVVVEHDTSGTIGTTAITDSADGTTFGSNTYVQFDSTSWGATRRASIFTCVLTAALTGTVSKMRFTTGGSTNKVMWVGKLAGATAISTDTSNHSNAQASSTSVLSGTAGAVTGANDISVICHGYDCSGGTPTYTAPAGYTQPTTPQLVVNGGNCAQSTVYKFVTTGTQSGTGTLGTAQVCGGICVTIKYTDAAGGPTGGSSVLSGGNTVGVAETCTTSGWTGSPTTYDYVWQTANVSDPTFVSPLTVRTNSGSGATTDNYTPPGVDDTRLLRCTVTAHNGSGPSPPVSSTAVTVVFPFPASIVGPSISVHGGGSPTVGGSLDGNISVWNPN